MYSAIKSEQILQPLDVGRSSTSSLKAGGGMIRNRSFRSNQNLKRGSIRGLSFLAAQAGIGPYSSNNNLDGRASPAPSFATSEVCPSLEPLRPSLEFFLINTDFIWPRAGVPYPYTRFCPQPLAYYHTRGTGGR